MALMTVNDEEAGTKGRWSAGRKLDVVLRLLRGEKLDEVSREVGVEARRLAAWRDEFMDAGKQGLKGKRATTRDPAFSQTDQAYVYAADDPVNETDPSGECTSLFNLVCVGGGSVGTTISLQFNPEAALQAVQNIFNGLLGLAPAGTQCNSLENIPYYAGVVLPFLLSLGQDQGNIPPEDENTPVVEPTPVEDESTAGEPAPTASAQTFATETSAANAAMGAQLASQLTEEEASSIFTDQGLLKPEVIAKSTEIINGTQLGIQQLVKILTSDGDNIANWENILHRHFTVHPDRSRSISITTRLRVSVILG